MVKSRGKLFTFTSGIITLVILTIIVGIASMEWIVEEYYLSMLDSTKEDSRAFAMQKLGEMRSVRSISKLVHLLERRTEMGRVADKKIVLRKVIEKTDAAAARAIVHRRVTDLHPITETLIRIGPPSIPALLELLDKEDVYLVSQACYALGEIGPAAKDAIPFLKAVKNRSRQCDVVAQEAIEKIRSLHAVPEPSSNREEVDPVD